MGRCRRLAREIRRARFAGFGGELARGFERGFSKTERSNAGQGVTVVGERRGIGHESKETEEIRPRRRVIGQKPDRETAAASDRGNRLIPCGGESSLFNLIYCYRIMFSTVYI